MPFEGSCAAVNHFQYIYNQDCKICVFMPHQRQQNNWPDVDEKALWQHSFSLGSDAHLGISCECLGLWARSTEEENIVWAQKSRIPMTPSTLSGTLRVFYYLRSNLLTDDPHYQPGTQVRHVLHQIKCTSWQINHKAKGSEEVAPG